MANFPAIEQYRVERAGWAYNRFTYMRTSVYVTIICRYAVNIAFCTLYFWYTHVHVIYVHNTPYSSRNSLLAVFRREKGNKAAIREDNVRMCMCVYMYIYIFLRATIVPFFVSLLNAIIPKSIDSTLSNIYNLVCFNVLIV